MGIVFFLASILLGLPVVALILSILANSKSAKAIRGAKKAEKETEGELQSLRCGLESLTRRLDRLERAGLPEGVPTGEAAQLAPPGPEPQERPVRPAFEPASPTPDRLQPSEPVPAAPAPAPPAAAPPEKVPPLPSVPAHATKEAEPSARSVAAARTKPAGIPVPAPPPTPLMEDLGRATGTGPSKPSPPSGPGWERRLGILLPVWIGAIALALAGAFLVKYSVEKGLLGPAARVTGAMLLGLVLLGAGEWLLRKKTLMTAHGASAAGVAVLYAAPLAGVVLYHLIPPWFGFAFLVLVTAAGVALSLRQGIVVAFVGLVGGFFTPYFIGVVSASPGRLFTYLLLLQAGLLVVSRKRQWTGMAGLTLILGLGAVFQRLIRPALPGDALWLGIFLLVSAGIFLWSARTWKESGPPVSGSVFEGDGWHNLLGFVSILGAVAALAILALETRFGIQEWAFLGILSAGLIVLGRLDARYRLLPWVAFFTTGTLAAAWTSHHPPADLPVLVFVCVGFGAVFALGGYLAHLRSSAPASWASLCTAGGLAAFLLAYQACRNAPAGHFHWGYASFILAIVYLAPTILAARPERRAAYGEAHLAAFCVAVTSFVSLAVPMELHNQWVTVAWALEVAALAWLLRQLRVNALGWLGLIVGALVVIRLLLNPAVLRYPIGELPVFNWILYGYGLPALAFAAAAFLYRKSGWSIAGEALAWSSATFAFALLSLEVRQGFHPGAIRRAGTTLTEIATYSHLWLAAGLVLLAFSRWKGVPLLKRLGGAFILVSAVKILLTEATISSPLLYPFHVGQWPVLNRLLYVYGLPLAVFAFLVWWYEREGDAVEARACSWLAGALAFVLATLEVRQVFSGSVLTGRRPDLVEWATYCHVWIFLGILLLLAFERWGRVFFERLAWVFGGLGVAAIALVDVLLANPLFAHNAVGTTPVFNWLLYVYGLPMLLMAAFAYLARGTRAEAVAGKVASYGGWLLAFVLISLEVRQFFHRGFLDSGRILERENYWYSAVWILFALFLLAVGIMRKGKGPRIASLVVIFLAVTKVFVYDLRQLQDLYRVGSFLALGASLLLISFLYQRFVFAGGKNGQ
jgi:uncharacterized membrane protein